ncbi:hypothetical protein [Companilactobacillus halodurans]|uniref:ABC transporter permease n=1 Tax=Companilactobacillus halodurans TaxID=2584183 RepID=A0A5P0ZU71_9LACO|nr:hypothetical protein [Companilactobacillus halodurans]MQS76029.1 hypothetical protein [Companilactobacillus halodurans]MQS96465.1 hypothetical protein [Companilactobacillus halodurans]
MKIRILLRTYLQSLFQDFWYLTMLFSLIVFGLTAEPLFKITSIKKFSFLLVEIFFLALFSTMNLYSRDAKENKYLKKRVNSYFADAFSQFLAAVIVNLFSGILIFIFSLILNHNFLFDLNAILALISCGFLGSSIATLFKTQWYNHPNLGQVGILVFTYLALTGSVIEILSTVQYVLPPLSKMIIALQNKTTIIHLLPITGQTFLYGFVLFVISSFIYRKNKKI